jgi:predicted thioesterase
MAYNEKIVGKKRGVSYFHRTAQPHTFATFPSWRIKRELVVKDLPRRKSTYLIGIVRDFNKISQNKKTRHMPGLSILTEHNF